MANGGVGSCIVVYHHAAGVYACAHSVVENQWHAPVDKVLEVGVLCGVFGLRHDDAAHLVFEERLTDAHFAFVLFVALGHHDAVVLFFCSPFDACKNRREVKVR